MNSPYETDDLSENIINFRSGFPSKSSLVEAAKILKKASNDFYDGEIETDAQQLIYLRTSDETKLLQILASFLSEQYQDKVIPSNLIFTNGASSGFIYLLSHLLPMNRKVIVASPTYQLLLNSLIFDLKYETESVCENSEGIDLNVVESILKREYSIYGTNEEFTCGIYIVPTFSNPTGMLYTEEFGKRITFLAAKYNAMVICDDVYNLLYATKDPPKRLVSYESGESQGHVISNGSFSKYLTPSLRLGWLEAHPPLIDKIKNWGLLQSANCLGQLSALIVTTAIKNGDVTRHLLNERNNIKARLDLAKSILNENLKDGYQVSSSMGGYFIWVSLPKEFPLDKFEKQCSQENILVLPGYIHTNMDNVNRIRLSISRADNLVKLRIGFEKICSIINNIDN